MSMKASKSGELSIPASEETVYIVHETDYFDDTHTIYGVFSSKEKAIKSLVDDYPDIEQSALYGDTWWRPIEEESTLKFEIVKYVVR